MLKYNLREYSFEETVCLIPGVVKVKDENYDVFSRIISGFKSTDSFLSSPFYYFFTGRYSLWIYKKNNAVLIFCKNPANTNEILIFPQLGSEKFDLVSDIILNATMPKDGFRLARTSIGTAEIFSKNLKSTFPYYDINIEIESELDWTYPSHTISTSNLLGLGGRRLKSLRQHINRINEKNISIEKIDFKNHKNELKKFIQNWSDKKNHLDKNTTLEIYNNLLNLAQNKEAEISGIKIFYFGKLAALEVWATLPQDSTTAISLAGFSDLEIRGMSEFQIFKLCKILNKKGITDLCLGGSEYPGLDNFKRKFGPRLSIEMRSISIKKMQPNIINFPTALVR